jgi:hypothetical protein
VQVSGSVGNLQLYDAPPRSQHRLPAESRLRFEMIRTRTLRVSARTAELDEPIAAFNLNFYPVSTDGLRAQNPRGGRYGWNEDGILEFRAAPGRGVLRVEAPGRAPLEIPLHFDYADDPFDVMARMQPESAAAESR